MFFIQDGLDYFISNRFKKSSNCLFSLRNSATILPTRIKKLQKRMKHINPAANVIIPMLLPYYSFFHCMVMPPVKF